MAEPLLYATDHARWSMGIRLGDDRLELTFSGKGLIDKPRTTAIPLADLKNFAVVPTAQIQHVIGGRLSDPVTDNSYDSELFVSWTLNGKLKKKRVFVSAQHPAFKSILEALKARRPEASLLDLSPDQAYQRMGFITPKQAVWIIVGLIVGLPIIGAGIILLIQFWPGSKS